jgi:hypothetical protein
MCPKAPAPKSPVAARRAVERGAAEQNFPVTQTGSTKNMRGKKKHFSPSGAGRYFPAAARFFI